MERIVKETGGAHIDRETTDPHTYFQHIAEELRTSYELACYQTNSGKDEPSGRLSFGRCKRDCGSGR